MKNPGMRLMAVNRPIIIIRLFWYNHVTRHINDWKFRRKWAAHPEWEQELLDQGWKLDVLPSKFRSGRLSMRDVEDCMDIVRQRSTAK